MVDEDAKAHLAFFADPELQKAIRGNYVPQTLQQTRKILETCRQGFELRTHLIWGMALRDDNRLIGEIGLSGFVTEQMADIGFYLSRDQWNRSYMTEAVSRVLRFAFEGLELNRVQATVALDNAASIRVLEKTGFAGKACCVNTRWAGSTGTCICMPSSGESMAPATEPEILCLRPAPVPRHPVLCANTPGGLACN
jgi:[ribosomal protein S5]-alanine N-acetyltransferase